MADDPDIEWLEKYKREGGALKPEDCTVWIPWNLFCGSRNANLGSC